MQPYLSRVLFQNLLSFGPQSSWVDLQRLNIFIGPNGSGKTNFISLIELMANPSDGLVRTINETGGTREWIHTRGTLFGSVMGAELSANPEKLHYAITLIEGASRFVVVEESLSREPGSDYPEELLFLRDSQRARVARDEGGFLDKDSPHPPLDQGVEALDAWGFKLIERPDESKSIFSQLRDPTSYDSLSRLAGFFGRIISYSNFDLGTTSNARRPQPPGAPDKALNSDLSNLPHVFAALKREPQGLDSINEHLARIYPDSDGLDFDLVGAYFQVYLREKSGRHVSTYHMSDGTLRFVCLLLILLNPDPPPLICLEEPEVGLHPDAISELARVIMEASERTQLIITTHSEALVSAFSDQPEAVLITSRDENGTTFRRLDREKLSHWLQDYNLGELWTSGQIGGNL